MATHSIAKSSRILTERQAGVARIVLSHPPVNVIDVAMMEELNQELARVGSDDAVSVLVFSGAGESFSSGADVAAHARDKVEEMLTKFHALIRAVIASRKITIAAVHGSCLGGGAELAMACDMVYTTDSAKWGFPEIKLGCYPPVAATVLAALVGQKQAADLILTGRTIDGREAAAIGLANRAVPRDELAAAVRESTDHLTRLSAATLAIAKKAIYAWDAIHFDKGLARAEKIYLEELLKTEDAREGVDAFLQKRKPLWQGR
jgi:cyclohexa-1,5-dienecarbonyl-CoA hydratase